MVKELEQIFLQRSHMMLDDDQKYLKRSSTSLIIREIQIKMAVQYHFTTCQDSYYKKINKCCQKCEEIEILLHCWKRCKNDALTMENSVEIPQKITMKLPLSSSNFTSGYTDRRIEIRVLKRYPHSHVHCSVIQIAGI